MPGRPDAVRIPASLVARHGAGEDRYESVVLLAEDLLEVDLDSLEEAYCRDQQTFFFCTRDPQDAMNRPANADSRPGEPRYRWEPAEDGVELGYLIDV
ncbi:hypothetical protein [Paludisphaera rhizosphaerae]|uniref:hypothetical protein n=1 Tax=Paludisphaera rhizosphaerae TaxID=2711216 RepID=UPI0013EA6F34|nr:hypothetical protein [Paludisphaera rhizosphaerae]